MPLAQTGISNFYDAIRAHDLSRKFQFRVLRLGPSKYSDPIMAGNWMVFMQTAKVPGRDISNHQLPYMGLQFNVPGTVTYTGSDAWDVTFRMPQDYGIRNILESWHFDVFNDETSTGQLTIPCPNHTIELALLNNAGRSIRQYTLYGVYIKTLGDVEYDVTDGGEPVTFNATFAYQYWRPSQADASGGGDASQEGSKVQAVFEAYNARISNSNTANCA